MKETLPKGPQRRPCVQWLPILSIDCIKRFVILCTFGVYVELFGHRKDVLFLVSTLRTILWGLRKRAVTGNWQYTRIQSCISYLATEASQQVLSNKRYLQDVALAELVLAKPLKKEGFACSMERCKLVLVCNVHGRLHGMMCALYSKGQSHLLLLMRES